jgi:hypothetical protein
MMNIKVIGIVFGHFVKYGTKISHPKSVILPPSAVESPI